MGACSAKGEWSLFSLSLSLSLRIEMLSVGSFVNGPAPLSQSEVPL